MRLASLVPLTTAFVLLTALAGCSDTDDSDGTGDPGDSGSDLIGDTQVDGTGGGEIGEFAGLWQLDSITLRDGDTETTATRDGAPASLRGDVRVVANGELRVRLIGLLNGILLGPAQVDVFPASVTGDTWRITTGPGQVAVFAGSLSGDTLSLDRDADHPDDTGDTDGPSQIVVTRIEEPPGDVIGTWRLVTGQLGDGTTITPTCSEAEGGGSFQIFNINLTIDDDYLVALETIETSYSDAGCTTVVEEDSGTQPGAAEERGTMLDLWLFDEGGSNSFEFEVDRSGDQLTLTRQSCLPQGTCEIQTPSVVTFEPVE